MEICKEIREKKMAGPKVPDEKIKMAATNIVNFLINKRALRDDWPHKTKDTLIKVLGTIIKKNVL